MYIRKLQIQNFMRLEGVSIDAEGKHVIIRGENGIGKSSVVDAIYEALHGTSSKDRPEPVHQGANKALISLDLGDYLVEKHIALDGKSRLVVKAADGSRINSPQKLLDGLLSEYSLDPVAFLDRRPQDQIDDVLRVCGVEPPVAQVEMITGEKCPARPGESADQYMERLSADEVGEWYRRRREQHRVVETNRGAVEKQKQKVDSYCTQSPARDAAVILEELNAAQAKQDAYQKCKQAKAETQREYERLSDLWNQVDTERLALGKQKAELEAKLKEVNAKIAANADRLEKGMQMVSEARLENEAAGQALAQCWDNTKQVQELRMELSSSQAAQKHIIEMNQATERLSELQAELVASQNEHGRLDRVLEDLRSLRKGLLEGLDLGVDGLEVGKGELRLHGVSFKQASLAQKLRVACAVAMKGNGALRLLRIDDGEHLDSESRAFLLKLASENGWQVIMTCVADYDQLQVEIVDQEPVEVKPARKAPRGKLFDTSKDAAMA
ncbi:MAG: AAA family ATPase [Planctomycetia bacterium]|nr:AAA family ATPase [Planctomycetia bacterium]